MAFIEILGLFKRYKKVVAVNHIHLDIKEGEMMTLLGPSGCGKTTTLRCIAGLEKPEEGDIRIDGKSMLSEGFVQPSQRGIGMVFQNYAVWPHMRVFNNVVYGLKIQKMPRDTMRDRAHQVLELVGLKGLEDRYPNQLSGGQQQRVALARALIRNPKVLLLDEPLSNLDAKLREKMRFEIKSLVQRMGITSVYVTHDQAEAMVISDRVVVMNSGNVVQIGRPEEIYERPASRFVADFIGAMNFMPAEIIAARAGADTAVVKTAFNKSLRCRKNPESAPAPGTRVFASMRPEDVEIHAIPPEDKENLFEGVLTHTAYLGNFAYYFVSIMDTPIRVQASQRLTHKVGDRIFLSFNPEKCLMLE
jgi:iron(III) transport system ATP-binding protein